jgi:hypothetical protein
MVFIVVGPELSNAFVDVIPQNKYMGSYLGASALLLLMCAVVSIIDFTPAEDREGRGGEAAKKVDRGIRGNVLSKGRVQPEPASQPSLQSLPPIQPTVQHECDGKSEQVGATSGTSANSSTISSATAITAVRGQDGANPDSAVLESATSATSRSLYSLVVHPAFALLASTAAILQLTMISLMQICPLVMVDEEFELWHVKSVIQGHILGMYLPSFFTGFLMDQFGKFRLMCAGVCLNVLAALLLLTDTGSFWSYFGCLATIGIGWNWGFVSATSALVDLCSVQKYTPAEQAKAKGFNDLCIQLLGAVGTLLTGFAVASFGWPVLVCTNGGLLALQLCLLLAWSWSTSKPKRKGETLSS